MSTPRMMTLSEARATVDANLKGAGLVCVDIDNPADEARAVREP